MVRKLPPGDTSRPCCGGQLVFSVLAAAFLCVDSQSAAAFQRHSPRKDEFLRFHLHRRNGFETDFGHRNGAQRFRQSHFLFGIAFRRVADCAGRVCGLHPPGAYRHTLHTLLGQDDGQGVCVVFRLQHARQRRRRTYGAESQHFLQLVFHSFGQRRLGCCQSGDYAVQRVCRFLLAGFPSADNKILCRRRQGLFYAVNLFYIKDLLLPFPADNLACAAQPEVCAYPLAVGIST